MLTTSSSTSDNSSSDSRLGRNNFLKIFRTLRFSFLGLFFGLFALRFGLDLRDHFVGLFAVRPCLRFRTLCFFGLFALSFGLGLPLGLRFCLGLRLRLYFRIEEGIAGMLYFYSLGVVIV